jgi:hypothetical protein
MDWTKAGENTFILTYHPSMRALERVFPYITRTDRAQMYAIMTGRFDARFLRALRNCYDNVHSFHSDYYYTFAAVCILAGQYYYGRPKQYRQSFVSMPSVPEEPQVYFSPRDRTIKLLDYHLHLQITGSPRNFFEHA